MIVWLHFGHWQFTGTTLCLLSSRAHQSGCLRLYVSCHELGATVVVTDAPASRRNGVLRRVIRLVALLPCLVVGLHALGSSLLSSVLGFEQHRVVSTWLRQVTGQAHGWVAPANCMFDSACCGVPVVGVCVRDVCEYAHGACVWSQRAVYTGHNVQRIGSIGYRVRRPVCVRVDWTRVGHKVAGGFSTAEQILVRVLAA